jgi:glycosyltransferase involved in cell wall biosynthesis
MACGCYVVGFTGLGGREYFDPGFSSPIEEGDVLAFAKETAAMLASDPATLGKRARCASEYVLSRYSPSGQREDLLAFFLRLLQA